MALLPTMKGPFFSPGFISALIGIALTISAYLEVWFWPAWPAFAVLDLLGRWFTWVELPFGVRAAVVVGLIALNVAFWAVAARLAWWLFLKLRRSGRGSATASG